MSHKEKNTTDTPPHREIDAWLRRRQAWLTELSTLYRTTASAAASGVRRDLATLETLERSFRKVMVAQARLVRGRPTAQPSG